MERVPIHDIADRMGQGLERHPYRSRKRRRRWQSSNADISDIENTEPSSVAQGIKIESEADMSLLKEEPVEYYKNQAQNDPVALDMKFEPSDDDEMNDDQPQIDPLSSEVKLEPHDEEINDNNVELEPSSAAQPPCQCLNYGSEGDSGESDDEEIPPLFIPRAQCSLLDTPLDADIGDQPTTEPEPAAEHALDVPPMATYQPWSLSDFDWKPFPNAPIPPESRREMFSYNDVGPTAPCADPYEIFISIWDRQFMEYIASETNRYAQQVATGLLETSLHPGSRISRWKDTTADELYVYFALVIGMGIVVKSRVEDYWSTTPDLLITPGFGAHMSSHRFALLSKCLHFRNNEDMCALQLDGSEAKIFKVQPLLSHLNRKFQSLYRLRQNIVLDDSLLKWNNWTDGRQWDLYNVTVKIKSYEICESRTGYMWRFEVQAHSNQRSSSGQLEDPLHASTPAIVLRLIQGLEFKGHTLWMESYYNSPCLARRLKSLGLDCAGTLRTDRKFVPQALHSLTKEDMRPGQLSGLTSGDVDVVVWKECQRVAMISTYHGNAVTEVRGVTKPISIHDFSVMMGGVDKKDMRLANYPIERSRAKVWYKKVFRRLLNVSVLNSYIIHCQSSDSSLSHRNFRKALVKSLLAKHCFTGSQSASTQVYDPLVHRLAEYPFGFKKVNQQRLRRKCANKACGKLVKTYCVGCKKTMCIDPCFLALHS